MPPFMAEWLLGCTTFEGIFPVKGLLLLSLPAPPDIFELEFVLPVCCEGIRLKLVIVVEAKLLAAFVINCSGVGISLPAANMRCCSMNSLCNA